MAFEVWFARMDNHQCYHRLDVAAHNGVKKQIAAHKPSFVTLTVCLEGLF